MVIVGGGGAVRLGAGALGEAGGAAGVGVGLVGVAVCELVGGPFCSDCWACPPFSTTTATMIMNKLTRARPIIARPPSVLNHLVVNGPGPPCVLALIHPLVPSAGSPVHHSERHLSPPADRMTVCRYSRFERIRFPSGMGGFESSGPYYQGG
jgi:hypothetical protein